MIQYFIFILSTLYIALRATYIIFLYFNLFKKRNEEEETWHVSWRTERRRQLGALACEIFEYSVGSRSCSGLLPTEIHLLVIVPSEFQWASTFQGCSFVQTSIVKYVQHRLFSPLLIWHKRPWGGFISWK